MNITVGELKRQLALWSDDTEVSFSGLDFYRLKGRGEKLVQIEFNQMVYKDKQSGKVVIENFE
ncbi:hypothetical protein [Aeromonas enteropelogenes]|uniref:hypothetical protein n=1 Tax=Aeromonas enteropelogenes TaxID=29489 RepID=UPI003B9EC2DA